jgi:hypothetical protein
MEITMLGFTRRPAAAWALLPLLATVTACNDEPDDYPLEPQYHLDDRGNSGSYGGRDGAALDVYSQNLYLGGNTGPLFDPTVVSDPTKLLPAVGTFWAEVQASDVPERMSAIADQIWKENPELVGVQEALQFVTLNGSFQPDGAGFVDLLGSLQAAIADKGIPYEVVVVQPGTSSALPLSIDFSTGAVTRYLGFTDRVVILKRKDVEVTEVDSGVYGAGIPIVPGVQIQRAWARVSVSHGGEIDHVVATHLETQKVRPVHDLQAAELMGILDALEGTTVLMGDLNSDAAAMEGDPSWTPTYDNLIAAGFSDVWELAPHSRRDPGYTCCQADDLRNLESRLDQRIDFVLVRSANGPVPGHGLARGHFRFDVIGDRARDKTPGGLWPSDHAGVVGSIRLAPDDPCALRSCRDPHDREHR